MSPGQRKLRRCVVIELRACPTYGRMTHFAVLGKSCGHVVWMAVPLKSVRWQEMHAVESPANTLFL